MGWQPANHCQTASVSSGSSLCISAEESTQSATVGRGCRLSIATGELSVYPGGSGLLRFVAKRSRFCCPVRVTVFAEPFTGRSQSRSAVVCSAAQRSFAEPFSGRSQSQSSRSAVVSRANRAAQRSFAADKRSFTQPVFSLRLVPVLVIMGVSQTCNLGCPFDNSAGTICSLKTNRYRDSWLRRAEFKLAFTPALTTTSHR
jgi:hypothetical protein